MQKYVPLHVHVDQNSNLIMLDSTVKSKKLAEKCVELGFTACATTGHDGIQDHVQHYKNCNENKIKPIIGLETYLCDDINIKDSSNKYYHLLLLAKNNQGLKNLQKLTSIAWEQGFYYRSRIDWSLLEQYKEGLIVTDACFIKGTKVLTQEGLKNIENFIGDELVLTHDGTYQKVLNPTKRHYSGDLITIKTQGIGREFTCTKDHKIYCINKDDLIKHKNDGSNIYYKKYRKKLDYQHRQVFKKYLYNHTPEWKNAEEIKIGDILLYPVNEEIEDIKQIDISFCFNPRSKKHIKNYNLIIDEKLLYILGLYAAEGSCIEDCKLCFSFNINESEIYNTCKQYIENIFGIEGKFIFIDKNNKVDLIFYSKELNNLFVNWFNKGAKNKIVPKFINKINPKLQLYFIKGLFIGDGYYQNTLDNRGYTRRRIVYATISEELVDGVTDILLRNNLIPKIYTKKSYIDKNKTNHKTSYYLEFNGKLVENIKNFIWHNEKFIDINLNDLSQYQVYYWINNKKYVGSIVKEIKKSPTNSETVYCLNVENNNSFVVNKQIVHNCLGGIIKRYIGYILYERSNENKGELIKKLWDYLIYTVNKFISIIGKKDFYLEYQASNHPDQIPINKALQKLAHKFNIKTIITTDVHYLRPEDKEVHQILLRSKPDNAREQEDFYDYTYLMTTDEIRKIMYDQIGKEETEKALKNTVLIAESVEEYEIEHSVLMPEIIIPDFKYQGIFKKYYNNYPYIEKFANSEDINDRYWLYLVEQGFIKKNIENKNDLNDYLERIDTELRVFWLCKEKINASYSAYHNTVLVIFDIIRECNSLISCGRGSVGAFLTCYLANITQIDPVKFNLPYWRYLHEDRPDPPDIDFDSEQGKKEKISKAIKNYFNSQSQSKLLNTINDKVIDICTFGTVSSRSAILAVARSLEIPVKIAEQISSLIPVDRGKNRKLIDCLNGNEEEGYEPITELVNYQKKYPKLFEYAIKLDGIVDKRSAHASGRIIYPVPYTEHNASMVTSGGQVVTQLNMGDSEYRGGIKFD